MGKMSELAQTIDDLRKYAEQLSVIADTLTEMFSGKQEKTAPTPVPESEKPKTPAITLEKVRAALAQKSRDGYTEQIRELLQKYGSDKLSGIDPENYAALMADAGELGNAT